MSRAIEFLKLIRDILELDGELTEEELEQTSDKSLKPPKSTNKALPPLRYQGSKFGK